MWLPIQASLQLRVIFHVSNLGPPLQVDLHMQQLEQTSQTLDRGEVHHLITNNPCRR